MNVNLEKQRRVRRLQQREYVKALRSSRCSFACCRQDQQARRRERRRQLIVQVEKLGVPYRWLSELEHMRFRIGDTTIDLYLTHCIVRWRVDGGQWESGPGLWSLRYAIGVAKSRS